MKKWQDDKTATQQNDSLTKYWCNIMYQVDKILCKQKCQVDKMSQDSKLMKYQVLEMESWWNIILIQWQNNQSSSWQDGKMASWQDGKLTRWQVDKMASWQDGKLTRWQVDKMASWQDGKLMNCHIVKKGKID